MIIQIKVFSLNLSYGLDIIANHFPSTVRTASGSMGIISAIKAPQMFSHFIRNQYNNTGI